MNKTEDIVKITGLIDEARKYHIKMKYGPTPDIEQYFNHLKDYINNVYYMTSDYDQVLKTISLLHIYQKRLNYII